MHTSHLNPELDTSIEMKTFLFLLVLGYTSSDKLDLTYLPPPGSQYAGGRPEDIQIPLEFPKETQSTTYGPEAGDNGGLSPENFTPTIGINRLPGPQDISVLNPGSPSPNLRNNQRVPTTTVSYAYTQTTTHPPTEGFETTIGPQVTGGFPTTDIFNNFPFQEPGLIYQGNNAQNHPGYQPTVNQFGQRPTFAPQSGPTYEGVSSQPGSAYEGNFNGQNRPGFKETIDQFGKPVLVPTTGPGTQFTGSSTPSLTAGQQFTQNYPNLQQVANQFQPGQHQQTMGGNVPGLSTGSFEQNQYGNQSFVGDLGVGNRPAFVPSTSAQQGFPPTFQPGTISIGENTSGQPGSFSKAPQGSYPGQQIPGNVFQPDTNLRPNQTPSGQQIFDDRRIANQRFPGSQSPKQYVGTGNTQFMPSSTIAPTFTPGVSNQPFPSTSVSPIYNNEGSVSGSQQYPGSQQFTGTPADNQNIFVPSSTTASTFTSGIPNQGVLSGTSIRPGISGQQFPSSIVPGSVSTPRYPGSEANAVSTVHKNRPERPQAEADRNAVILNYENEITPEEFAYSFDTSNGIHADENGTAIDGVKAQGSYSYTGDDGKVYSVVYTADEDGFRPRGDHLPTAPPIPEAIQRVIEQAEKDKAAGITHDGSYDEDKYGHNKYQGASRRPLLADRVISNADDTNEDGLPETVEKNKDQRVSPQTGQRQPIISSDRGQYTNGYSKTGPRTDEQFVYDLNKKKPGQQSTQRPISRVTDISENDQGTTLGEDFDQNQGTTGRPFVSRRPINQSGKNQYNSYSNEDYDPQDSHKQRPIGKVTSTQEVIQDQDTDAYAEGPEYEGDVSKNRFKIKNSSRRPINYNDSDEYDTEDAATSDTYKNEKGPKRPLPTRKPLSRPSSNIVTGNDDALTQQSFDQYGRPVSRKGQSNIKQQIESKPPSKPSSTSFEDYDAEEDYVTKLPSKNYPGNTADHFSSRDRNIPSNYPGKTSDKYNSRKQNTPYYPGETSDKTGSRNQNTPTYYPGNTSNKFGSRDQNIPSRMRQRPTSSGVEVSADKDIETPGEGEDYIESDTDQNIQLQDYNNNRPTLPGKTPLRDDRYEEEISESEDLETTERDYTGRPKESSTVYSATTGRPQISQSPVNNDRIQNAEEKRINAKRPGMKFGQRINRPGFNQNTDVIESNVYDNHPTNESGYQYIPPRRKFEHNEVQVTPNRFMGTTRRPFTERPTPGDYYKDKDIPSKPFMTPNVSYLGEEDNENDNQGVISGKPGVYIEKEQGNQFDEYSNGGTTPDDTYGDDEITSSKPFDQFSTRRPAFQQPTGRPKYTQNVPSFTKKRINQEAKPSQDTNTRYNKGTKTPSGIVSSTTPMPSTRTQSSTFGSTRPGQRDETYYSTPNGYKKPGKVSISATTPLPSQSPNFDGLYNEDIQYQTTYRPSGTIQPNTGYEDGNTGQRFPAVGSTDGEVNITPGVSKNRYQGNQPSTTYRPNLVTGPTQPSSTIRSGVSVDRYGRPIIKPGSSTTAQSNRFPSNLSPEGTVDIYGRPVSPGYDSTVQEYIPGVQNIPSSTATPVVLVDAFGRPVVRPGSGSTVQGFVPASGNEVSSTIRPDVIVDAFGRPVPTPQNTFGNGDYVSDGLREPSSTARPQSIDAFGRPIIRPGSAIQEYGPGGQIQPSTVSPGVTVDAYGRPITTLGVNSPGSTGYTAPSGNIGQGLPETLPFGGRPSTSVPSAQFRGDQRYQTSSMRPDIGQGTFSTFQPSTERIIGEDFSGPKQQQKFDPEHGYYYK